MRPALLFLVVFLLPPLRAEIIDRIAVSVDSQVITESEVIREIRLTAFLNGEPLDFSPQAKRKAADRLIEQKLIRKEIELGRYAQPSPEEMELMLKQIQAQRFPAAEQYHQALDKYGVSDDELRTHLLWQLTLLRFIGVRFRPAVQVTDEEMHQYFDQHLGEMEKRAAPGKTVSFDDARDQIEQILTGQLVDKELNDWLAETQKRTRVEFHPEAFQ
jgi:hypothetical protein